MGSHLCETLLGQGYRVICVDNFRTGSGANVASLDSHPRFRLIEHDITDPLAIGERLDEVFNLACAASPPRYRNDPVHTILTSVVGTSHLLEFAAGHRATFLQASTSEVYGDPEVHPQAEGYHGNVNCTGPRACYDEGKRAAETLCFDFLRLGWADVRVARIFNTYGPRMQPGDGRIVSTFIDQALRGQPLTLYGTGEQTRSFCYVSDLVEGLIALMRVHPNPKGPVNLGNPREFAVKDLARLVLERIPARAGMVFRPLPEDDPKRRRPDISRAKAQLNWEPRISLDEGLDRTIEWFRSLSERGGADQKPKRPSMERDNERRRSA